nr:transient receptor potential channel pyrexia-like isoform X2 [Procambarus clarkii]
MQKKGLVMVADVENQQKTPLMSALEMQELKADDVNALLKRDEEEGVRNLVQKWGANSVWRPRLNAEQSALITTSLHVAAKEGALKCLRVLLDANPPKEVLDAPDQDGTTPLMVAVAEARPRVAEMLLKAGAHINARNNKGQTVLHILTNITAKGAKSDEILQELLDLLLSHSDIDLEPHEVLTPLALAASKLPQGNGDSRTGGLISLCRKLVKAGASLQEDGGDGSIEEILHQKQAFHAVLMGGERMSAPKRPARSQFLDMILMGKGSEDIKIFLENQSDEERHAAANCRFGQQTLLFRAVDLKNEDLVQVLIKFGANPWALGARNELPIHRAASRGHVSIFNHIIDKMKGGTKPVDFQDYTFSIIQKLMESDKKQKNIHPDISHSKCLQRLMQDDVILNINQEYMGQTALHVAASFNNQEAMSELLCKGAFLGAHSTLPGNHHSSILDSLLPATLERAMNGCIKHHPANNEISESNNVLSEDYMLKLDYRFLVPPADDSLKKEQKSINETETLMDISRSKRHRHAIKHPLVQILLYAKWRKALPLYLLNLGIYFFFVILLTAFVYSIKDLRILEAQAESYLNSGSSNRTIDDLNSGSSNKTIDERIENKQVTVNVLMAFLLPITIYIFIREVFQIVFSRDVYLKNIENYLEWFLVVVVIVLCSTNLAADVTRHLAAWAMIVAWYEFVLILGRAPPLAIYITMLRHVSWNFLKLIFLYGALLLAFTISFNIILQPAPADEDTDFRDFWSTLPKAIVMATGEFEYSDLSQHFSRRIVFFTSALLVFLLFLFLIFLVLMNVMNGLAVTDTQKVVEDAMLYSLTSRLELVYLIESFFLTCPGLQSHINRVQLLSGAKYTPILYAQMNKPIKKQRLLSGKHKEFQSKLDDYSAECLRNHRQQILEEENQQGREDPLSQYLPVLQELQVILSNNPQILHSGR